MKNKWITAITAASLLTLSVGNASKACGGCSFSLSQTTGGGCVTNDCNTTMSAQAQYTGSGVTWGYCTLNSPDHTVRKQSTSGGPMPGGYFSNVTYTFCAT